jgi:glycerophosphoryl diester phosphodiesterase
MLKAEQLPCYEPLADGQVAIAHRGGNAANAVNLGGGLLDKQNTLAAFESASRLGVPYCETDVVATRDGQLLTFHGSGTPRQRFVTTPEIPTRRQIENMTLAQTRQIRIGGEPIPTLAEVLDSLPGMRFFIDPKTDTAVELLPDVLVSTNSFDRVCVGAFKEKRNRRFAEIMTVQERRVAMTLALGGCSVVAALLMAGNDDKAEEYFAHSYATSWNAIQHITKPMVDRLPGIRVPVFAHIWLPSVATREQIDAHLDKGVNGVMGDQIELIVDAIKAQEAN